MRVSFLLGPSPFGWDTNKKHRSSRIKLLKMKIEGEYPKITKMTSNLLEIESREGEK